VQHPSVAVLKSGQFLSIDIRCFGQPRTAEQLVLERTTFQGETMSSIAVWEGLLLATMAVALGLIHAWNNKWARQRRADAEEASRLHEVRQEAVNQLKFEQRSWAVSPETRHSVDG
jgi:hypothetical protein